jgi:YesN/AraC family two-component response regulator
MVREQHPDIVITDIKMPEMDGIELIKHLVASGFDGEILVLSNFNDFELVREALKCGAHDYMLKLTLKSENFMQTLNEIASKLDEKNASRALLLRWSGRTKQTGFTICFSPCAIPSTRPSFPA